MPRTAQIKHRQQLFEEGQLHLIKIRPYPTKVYPSNPSKLSTTENKRRQHKRCQYKQATQQQPSRQHKCCQHKQTTQQQPGETTSENREPTETTSQNRKIRKVLRLLLLYYLF